MPTHVRTKSEQWSIASQEKGEQWKDVAIQIASVKVRFHNSSNHGAAQVVLLTRDSEKKVQ